MVDPGPDIPRGLELCLGAHSARKVTRGPILWSLLPRRQSLAILVRAQAGAVCRAQKEAVGHHCFLRRTEDCSDTDLRGGVGTCYTQRAHPLAAPYSGKYICRPHIFIVSVADFNFKNCYQDRVYPVPDISKITIRIYIRKITFVSRLKSYPMLIFSFSWPLLFFRI